MNSVNVNIPVVNLPQVSTHQSEAHRAPMVHQAQNAEINRDRLDLHMRTANEAEAAEGKNVDPDDHKEQKQEPKKEEGEQNGISGSADDEPETEVTMSDSGRLIDLEA
ncbi:MAG: hypothetical protein LBH93_07240 [Chitinispirillales bacterium]|jgi:hypothetical protein|nr:hypothetical protein [Chitinispirillales bacterium]